VQASPDSLFNRITAARDRIEGVASRTPLVEAPSLSKEFGRQVYLKLECYQPIRVFKIRGAYNRVSQAASRGVVAASSGNHGIAVAYSARLLGKKCTVVVPENAVQEKMAAIAELGAEVVKYGRFSSEREAKARELAKERGEFIHPYDDPEVIAGQGTCGLEIAEQLDGFDSVLVPVGGGGLISGISTAVKTLKPSANVFGVEPVGASKLGPSLKQGGRVALSSPKSIADGLLPNSVGELAFKICRGRVAGTFEVSEDEILEAMWLLLEQAHVVAEPSGAVPLAALLAGRDEERLGKRVVLVISGGNVSIDLLKKILEES
jgi:threonine dehydratase